jgi:hypothetical protein
MRTIKNVAEFGAAGSGHLQICRYADVQKVQNVRIKNIIPKNFKPHMDRKVLALIGLGATLFLLVAIMPPEKSLGNSYKFIYIHIPLSVIVLGSVLLYPLIIAALRNTEFAAMTFSIVTLLFSVLQLLVSILFMEFAWSGIAFYEPRMLFNVLLTVILAGAVVLGVVHHRLALIYSVAIPFASVWLYNAVMANYTFQLHPVGLVGMNALLMTPFVVSIPFSAILYALAFEKIRVYLKRLSERDRPLPQRS